MYARTKVLKTKDKTTVSHKRKPALSQSVSSPVDRILFLQKTVGNLAVERLFRSSAIQAQQKIDNFKGKNEQGAEPMLDKLKASDLLNFGHHSDSSAAFRNHRDLDIVEVESTPEANVPISASEASPHPTGVEKTEVDLPKLHFGARYKHSLKSSGGSLEGIKVNETVKRIKDDFKTKFKDIKLSDRKKEKCPPINRKGEIADWICITFGAIVPAVKRLRENKKPAESLLGEIVDHQKLYYWDAHKPPGWKKFVDVTIKQCLYDLPGLIVVTIDNGLLAPMEEFTHKGTHCENKRELLSINDIQTKQTFRNLKVLQPTTGAILQQQPIRKPPPSKIIPDLDKETVEAMSLSFRFAVAPKLRQELIDMIVNDRKRKGTDFSIIEGEKPKYVSAFPSHLLREGLSPNANGVTVGPKKPGGKPQILIGPKAFGESKDPLNHRMVRLYSAIMHEYQHALQWKQPARRRAIGEHGREVEAFFWEIENSKKTGLYWQKVPFRNVWNEAKGNWQKFKISPEWKKLKNEEKQRYIRWHKRVLKIAKKVLGTST